MNKAELEVYCCIGIGKTKPVQIAELTGMHLETVITIVERLIRQGEVERTKANNLKVKK